MESYIYLTSSSSPTSSHSNNTPSHFTNTLYAPILLSSNIRYQIGIVNILYPKSFFILLSNDDESSLKVYENEEVIDTFSLSRNIINGEDPADIIEAFACPFLRWNESLWRCELVALKEEEDKDVSIVFGSRVATVLGFNYAHHYNRSVVAPRHSRADDGGVDYILCQSDVVTPSCFGNEMLPILDAFVLEGAGGRGFTTPVYKTLNTFHLSSITIKLVDQLKREIHFDDLYSSTCVLHIRPLYTDEWCSNHLSSLARWTGSNV